MSTTAPRPGGTGGSDGTGTSEGGQTPSAAGTDVGAHPDRGRAVGRAHLSAADADRAARAYWEAEADLYQAEHGAFLAGARGTGGGGAGTGFVWGPEGLSEAEAQLLGPIGDLRGRRVLEVGCGAAQCSAWLAARGVQAVGVDIAVNQLRHARMPLAGPGPDGMGDRAGHGGALRAGGGEGVGFRSVERTEPTTLAKEEREGAGRDSVDGRTGTADGGPAEGTAGGPLDRGPLHVVAATATALPFADRSFDAAFASYGAVQFVADLPQLLAEVRRVLVPGGPWVFSVTHPIRWAFPDDPGPDGLTATMSYFDRTPYVEVDGSGEPVYAEFHRTLSDYVAALVSGGFAIEAVVEPEWPAWNHAEWGGWSPLRGGHLPGTLILGCRAPLALHPTTLEDPNG